MVSFFLTSEQCGNDIDLESDEKESLLEGTNFRCVKGKKILLIIFFCIGS